MNQKQTRDFLIRNMPIEIYHLLEKSAEENHRSKTQEAIVALTNSLHMYSPKIKQPLHLLMQQKHQKSLLSTGLVFT